MKCKFYIFAVIGSIIASIWHKPEIAIAVANADGERAPAPPKPVLLASLACSEEEARMRSQLGLDAG